MAAGFTDDEILVLLALDAELDPDLDAECRTQQSRLWDAAWWVALAIGAVAGAVTLLQAQYLVSPSHFGG